MNTKQALEIKKALIALSDALDMDVRCLASRITLCNCDKEASKILAEASNEWNRFDDAEMIDKAKMLGIEITEVKAYPER